MTSTNRRFVLRRPVVDEALVRATDGAFEAALDEVCRQHFDALDESDDLTVEVSGLPGLSITVRVKKSCVLRQGYSAKRWNEWPRIRPPEGVWMRVRGPQKGPSTYRDVLVFRYNGWWNTRNESVRLPTGVVFKPFSD